MGGLLNVGTRALQANQVALQTAGHNIANVNTKGYSRQTVVLQTIAGQFSGGGYVGNGVGVLTIQRNYSAFLTQQSALAGSTASADIARTDKLKQLEGIFAGGRAGLGAAVNDMLNAFSDVASAPTDLTARTVAITRVDETAARMRSASQGLDDLQQAATRELSPMVDRINSLANSIAAVNEQIARTKGSGQSPNDLLDQREQLVRDLNQYVQTTSVAADDGTVGIFIGGSQALVLGGTASPVSLLTDDGAFGDTAKSKLAINRGGQIITLDENTMGGGEASGLLRFQNTDLAEGRNLLGRLTVAITTSMNNQHKLGLDLDGNAGGNLFTPTTFSGLNVLPGTTNGGSAALSMSISDATKFVASDYEVSFTSASQGSIVRRSDGVVTAFDFGVTNPVNIDGLNIAIPSGTPTAGDRFLLKPFSNSASNMRSQFSTPRALAVASPVAASASVANTGSLALAGLKAVQTDPNLTATVTLTFNGAGTFDVVGTGTGNPIGVTYTPGQAIGYNGWSLTLQGAPQAGDTFTVQAQPAANRNLNAGNAVAMMDLRDKKMFDGGSLTDGYASLIAQIGIRSQSANYAAEISGSIAANLERDRTGVAGVNLDEEAAKLLQFQQAYQASAKMIQIAQGIFDTLIQTMSR